MTSRAMTPEAYLKALPADHQEVMRQWRQTIKPFASELKPRPIF